jgi:hypothetical protein
MYVSNQMSQCFIEWLETFLETAVEYKKEENMSDVHYIWCSCVDCCNEKKTQDIEEIREHLLVRGFMSEYTYWMEHGEYKEVMLEDTDVGGDDDVDGLDEMLRNVESDFSGKYQNDKFSQIMKDYETPLFLGCKKEHNKLHIVLTLLQMKASNSWSDKGFN